MAILAAQERERVLQLLADTMRAVDPYVRDVVLIGSAVYAPDLARDYDLVFTTASEQEHDTQWTALYDALNKASDKTVDLILRHPGETIGDLAKAILAGQVVIGNGETIQEAYMFLEEGGGSVSSFKEASGALSAGETILKTAEMTIDPGTKDRLYKAAYDELFHAARNAAQAFLGRKETRWGGVAGELSAPLDRQFREMITVLHVKYAYDGRYPKDPKLAAREFTEWKERVLDFISELRKRTLDRESEMPER